MFDAGEPLMKPALPLLLAAMLSWLSGCSTAPSRPAPPAAIVPQTLAPSSGVGPYQIFALAAAQGSLGIPYQFGGADPYRGFDCSGLVQYSYLQAGLLLPRTAAEQLAQTQPVTPERLLPGDLLFFRIDAPATNHVGLYLGSGTFLHAPSTGKRVRLDRLDDGYWRPRFAGAGRVMPPP